MINVSLCPILPPECGQSHLDLTSRTISTRSHEKIERNRLLTLSLNDQALTAIINNFVIVIETML
jgi:hypothetical protein